MNISHLASSANLGGALQSRHSALRIQVERGSSLMPGQSGIWMRRLISICYCLLSAAQVVAAPAVSLAWDANLEPDIRSYVLSYGNSPGTYPNVINVGLTTEASVTNLTEGATYFFVVSAINSAGVQSPYSTELAYLVESVIPSPNGWALKYADSEDPLGYRASYAFDGNPNTFWHTTWRSNPAPPPHEIQIDLGTDQAIKGFRYLPRQDESLSGTVGQYEFFVSPDGVNWGSPVATGTFPCTYELKEVQFPTTRGKYIRLRGLTDGYGGPYMSVAEIELIQDSTSPPVTNRAPICSASAQSMLEDTTLPLTISGTDADGDALSFSVVTAPTNGVLSGIAPNLIYTPFVDRTGLDSFQFVASDGAVISAPATVSIEITPTNDAPTAYSTSATLAEGSTVPITLTATDVDGNPLTFMVVRGPANGTLSGTAPNLTYAPAANFSGSDEFTFRVNDGAAYSAPATVSITVTKSPLLNNKSRISRSNWILKYVDSEQTPDSPGIAAFDGDLGKSWQTRSSTGSALPHEIQIDLGSIQKISGFQYLPRQDLSTVGNIGDYEFYVSLDGENWGSPAATGQFPNSSAEVEVNFTARSGKFVRLRALTEINGGTTTCIAELNVLREILTNQLPLADAQTMVVQMDASLSVVLGGSDPEGSALTHSIVSGPLHGAISGTPPNLTYLPDPGFIGNDQFTFQTNDGADFSDPATVSIRVETEIAAPRNTAPMFIADVITLTTAEDMPVEGQLFATDADAADVLTFQKTSGPAWLTVSADGQLGGTPRNADVGTSSFSIEVHDPLNASAFATLTITVTNTNDVPVFRVSPLVGVAGTEKVPYGGMKLADSSSDPDPGDTIIFSKASGPVWLTVSSSGTLSGTPPSGSAGTNLFTIRATDSTGASSDTSLQIKIQSNTLPLPWTLDRVGKDNIAAGATFSSGSFSISGSGVMASTEDSGSLGWQTLSGNGEIIARVTKLNDTGTGTRVGVMIRDSLAPNSRQVFVGVDGAGKYQWTRRLTTGGSTAKLTGRAPAPNTKIWVRLVRTLDVIVASKSTDGINWTKIGKCTVALPKNCYIGLWVGSGENQILNTSQLGNVVVTP